MSYTPPDWNNLDFTDYAGAYTPPDWSNLTFGGSGISGVITVTLDFASALSGVVAAGGPLSARLDFDASFAGEVRDVEGVIAAELSFGVAFSGFQDWLAGVPPIQLQEVYRLIITGAADGLADLYIGGISSWQATNQAGERSSYLQAVIPAADQYMTDIDARKNGELVIQKGYRLAGGHVTYSEILRSRFDTLRPDRGRRSLTVTVSGYQSGKPEASGARALTVVRTISTSNGKRRVQCEIDLFLQPGMTVTALNQSFKADFINYYVNDSDKFCEVGER